MVNSNTQAAYEALGFRILRGLRKSFLISEDGTRREATPVEIALWDELLRRIRMEQQARENHRSLLYRRRRA
jgi:hypothetical protein